MEQNKKKYSYKSPVTTYVHSRLERLQRMKGGQEIDSTKLINYRLRLISNYYRKREKRATENIDRRIKQQRMKKYEDGFNNTAKERILNCYHFVRIDREPGIKYDKIFTTIYKMRKSKLCKFEGFDK